MILEFWCGLYSLSWVKDFNVDDAGHRRMGRMLGYHQEWLGLTGRMGNSRKHREFHTTSEGQSQQPTWWGVLYMPMAQAFTFKTESPDGMAIWVTKDQGGLSTGKYHLMMMADHWYFVAFHSPCSWELPFCGHLALGGLISRFIFWVLYPINGSEMCYWPNSLPGEDMRLSILYNRIFHCKPSSYWGTPIFGNPHLDCRNGETIHVVVTSAPSVHALETRYTLMAVVRHVSHNSAQTKSANFSLCLFMLFLLFLDVVDFLASKNLQIMKRSFLNELLFQYSSQTPAQGGLSRNKVLWLLGPWKSCQILNQLRFQVYS